MKRKRIRMKVEESRQGHMKRVLQTLLQEKCNICKFGHSATRRLFSPDAPLGISLERRSAQRQHRRSGGDLLSCISSCIVQLENCAVARCSARNQHDKTGNGQEQQSPPTDSASSSRIDLRDLLCLWRKQINQLINK